MIGLYFKMGNDIVTIGGDNFKKESFMIEETHPAIGRILIVDGKKFRLLDGADEEQGTFIRAFTENDEETIIEYDNALETLSEKLVDKVDIKRMIKENIKHSTLQNLKTGLFILKQEEEGRAIEEEHHRGCYEFKMFYKNQRFSFFTGSEER